MTDPWVRRVEIGPHVLYQGDCREILPTLGKVDAVVTDPVWPNHGGMFGDIDARQLLADALCVVKADRVVIHLRNDQDPRFLCAVPDRWPFLQCMWMRYAAVGYLGRFMTGNDVAYAFGDWPPLSESSRIIPAMSPVASIPTPKNGHPSPRNQAHVNWLVRWWGGSTNLDPFMGSGTTGVACVREGRSFIGIELDPGYFDIACERIRKEMAQPRLDLPKPPEPTQEPFQFDGGQEA